MIFSSLVGARVGVVSSVMVVAVVVGFGVTVVASSSVVVRGVVSFGMVVGVSLGAGGVVSFGVVVGVSLGAGVVSFGVVVGVSVGAGGVVSFSSSLRVVVSSMVVRVVSSTGAVVVSFFVGVVVTSSVVGLVVPAYVVVVPSWIVPPSVVVPPGFEVEVELVIPPSPVTMVTTTGGFAVSVGLLIVTLPSRLTNFIIYFGPGASGSAAGTAAESATACRGREDSSGSTEVKTIHVALILMRSPATSVLPVGIVPGKGSTQIGKGDYCRLSTDYLDF